MKIDVRTLGTFNRLAHEDAGQAAAWLGQLTGIEPTVEAATVDLARRRDVISGFRGRDLVGMTTEFSDALVGTGAARVRSGGRTDAREEPPRRAV